MNKLLKKLRSNAAETILETLCAILIAALALTSLVGIVTVSAKTNRTVNSKSGSDSANLAAIYKKEAANAATGTLKVYEGGYYSKAELKEKTPDFEVNVKTYTAGDYVFYEPVS